MSDERVLIMQISDLHLLSGAAEQPGIVEGLVGAIGTESRRRARRPGLLCFTGDVFDSSAVPLDKAVQTFTSLLERIMETIGGRVPTVIVPGNHDRRRFGLLAPFDQALFERLRVALSHGAFVHGTRIPFLAELVPREVHRLPLFLVAYDSTYLPSGLISAGGILRQADLLQVAAEIGDNHPDWPVLMLLHHHLVPTSITDTAKVEVGAQLRALRWSLEHVLPHIVPNADHEELTMTALGSGTALSTLHALGRAVIVLHGHKHYAMARVLSGLTRGQGDVLIVSAGSAGSTQSYIPSTTRGSTHLWPSFNAIELSFDRVEVDGVFFGYRKDTTGEVLVRPMLRANRHGQRWQVDPMDDVHHQAAGPMLERNELWCRLERGSDPSRWDLVCVRQYTGEPGEAPAEFLDTIDALEDGQLQRLTKDGTPTGPLHSTPVDIRLVRDQQFRFRITNGVCRTLSEATRLFGARWSPYAWMGIMNRYASKQVRIEIENPMSDCLVRAFASEIDLHSGLERPIRLSHRSDAGRVVLEYFDCPPRTLLRVHWPLEP